MNWKLWFGWLSIGSLSLLLNACSVGATAELQDYAKRVARVLEQPLPQLQVETLQRQAVQDNRLALEQNGELNLLEFLRLNRCALGHTVAQQNSSLGKVALPSQQLHFTRDFVQQAPACIELLQDEQPKLASALAQARQQKIELRMAYWWNAWIGSQEWQAFTAIAAAPLEMTEEQPAHINHSLAALDYALAQGQRWQQQAFEYDEAVMEAHLQQLLLGETLGRWQRALVLQTATLNQVASMLERRYQQKSLCATSSQHQSVTILQTVFRKYYLGKVQPYLSRSRRLEPPVLAHSRAMPDSWHQSGNAACPSKRTNDPAANGQAKARYPAPSPPVKRLTVRWLGRSYPALC